MWDWDLIWHIFRILWSASVAVILVAAVLVTIYTFVMFFGLGVLEIHEKIMDRRVERRRAKQRDDHDPNV